MTSWRALLLLLPLRCCVLGCRVNLRGRQGRQAHKPGACTAGGRCKTHGSGQRQPRCGKRTASIAGFAD